MQLTNPKIYHILHFDKLSSVVNGGYLLSDAIISTNAPIGTTVGMNNIKQRRLTELTLNTHPDLYVGQCVPFYFCPRSVMLYMMSVNSTELTYQGGQDSIVHLEIDFDKAVQWANTNGLRWAFTNSNAGSYYFRDTNDIANLSKLDWNTINSNYWSSSTDTKQAEFLCEDNFPWELVERIGVNTMVTYNQVQNILQHSAIKPNLEIINSWYY
jgi:hypothetical protein